MQRGRGVQACRGRLARKFAGLAAAGAICVFSIGAAPAQGATNTAWIPLFCSIGGVVPVHVGAALQTTYPDSVMPNDTFNLTGTSTTVIFPPSAQQGGAVFNGDAVQGIVQNFQTNLTNASVAFQDTPGTIPVQSSPTQFNAVGAVQPPNQAASNVRINGGDTTRAGFQPSTPAESFSFGDVPTDSTGQTGNRYGPVPGVGGGPNPTDGTPDTLPDIGPITVTGDGVTAGQENVVIVNRNPGGPQVAGLPSGNPLVADNTISFHEMGSGTPGTYGTQLAADCAFDTSTSAVAKPVASWVDCIQIPIGGAPTLPCVGGPGPGGSAGGGAAQNPATSAATGKVSLGGAQLKGPTKAVLTVNAPGAGGLVASDAKASGRVLRASASKKAKALIKKSSAKASKAGPVKLTLKLSAAGKAAQKKTGKVKVKVKVTFTPSGAAASAATSATKSVTFKKK